MGFVEFIAAAVYVVICICIWLVTIAASFICYAWAIRKLLSRTHLKEDTRNIISFLLSIAITVCFTLVFMHRNGFFFHK